MSPDREAWIVVDLGFGDAGKGTVTDFLVRDRGAELVVRWNGGAQAGHNVVTPDGRHHTFSQFGAGSFVPGVRTLLGPGFLLHPGGMLVEARHLRQVGVPDALDRTVVDARAPVITPFQQAANRVRELLRGPAAHGTCGVGIGECVHDTLTHPEDALTAGDLSQVRVMIHKLGQQRARKHAELNTLTGARSPRVRRELELFQDDDLIDRVVDQWTALAAELRIATPTDTARLVEGPQAVVFEGAQGILLDEDWGFHPHTTWSDCTPRGAATLLEGTDRAVTRLGVLRTYGVRHGAGPMPTADAHFTATQPEAHNPNDGWQGAVRCGPLDGVLLRYAREVCGHLDGLALNHLDRVGLQATVCEGYHCDVHSPLLRRDARGIVRRLVPGAPGDLEHRARLGALLGRCEPVLSAVPDLADWVQQACGAPVILEGWGPQAGHKRWRGR